MPNNPKKSKTSIAEESKHVLKSIKSEMLSPRNRENQNIETRPSSTLSKNTTTTIKSIQQQYLSPRAIPTIHTTIRSGAVPTMRLKPQSPFKVVWSPNMKVSLDDFLNSPQTPGRCFLGFDMDLKPIYCDKCNFCVTTKLTSTKSISTLSELSESKLVADGKTKTSITQNVPYASVTKNATSFTPRVTRASSIRSKQIMTESPLTPDCCFLGFDSELKPVFCKECKIASPSARTTGPCSKQRNSLTPMKTDFADSKFGGFINKENLMTFRKQLYRSDERKYIPVPCLDIKQLIGKNPDDEKYTKIWTPYQDCSQFFRPYSYRDAKVGCGSETRSNDIAMALLEEAFENDEELVIAVESG